MNPTEKQVVKQHQPHHIASTWWIISSLLLGIGVGLFFGEPAASLQIFGNIYIGLLQMTVLPFILFAMIANIGLLNYFEARLLARYGLLVLAVLWLIGASCVWLIALALPKMESGAFFSSLLTEVPATLDFIDLFIPANPFMALSSNAVPAVVLFSILFGMACIGHSERRSLLQHCDQAAKVLLKVNGYIVKLTPIGVFGIAASAAGTLTLEEFGLVQAYILMLFFSVMLTTIIILPLLIMCCTPFTYKQIFQASRDALLTAFVVGSVFVIIPLLTRGIYQLFQTHKTTFGKHVQLPDLVLPLAYPFPDIGRLLSLVFVVFAAWFYGKPLTFIEYPEMLSIGLFLSFGKLITAIPMLLDIFHIPDDIFNLFLTVGVLCRRFADVAGAMHLLTFTILTTAIMTGCFKIRWRKLIWTALVISISFVISISALHLYLTNSVSHQPKNTQNILLMQPLFSSVDAKILSYSKPNPVKLAPEQTILDRIKQRKTIRIGIMEDNLPFSYYNKHKQLVGFDIELMHHLASDLDVAIEFVPYESEYLIQELNNDHFDIAVSSISANPRLLAAQKILYSESYLDTNYAFVVPDHQRTKYNDADNVKLLQNIRVGVRKNSVFANLTKHHFPNLQVDELDTEAEFFAIESFRQQVLVTSAEGGSAWTLLYPDYVAVNPLRGKAGAPLVIAIGGQDFLLEKYLSTWIALNRQNGTINELFEHWIQGKNPSLKKPRWSIWRNIIQEE